MSKNISLEILKEKFLDEKNDKKNFFNKIKKSGIFTGLKTSLTIHKNFLKNQVNHFLNKNAVKKINENLLFENNDSVVYRRNVVNLNGAKRSAVPHGIIKKIVDEKKPIKPRNGVVITPEREITSKDVIEKKLKLIPKLFNKG